ncbi:hypothetical protein E2562_015157 [Oryza meyeriana var. granulata]|uniref:Uncharacterized protein n=1 Tax=Oryza meyeriana var. granulata TaxID=110450 RepID=A0A6G1EWL0_9ORYZ|nr:hypothetical protein E2562_015157 [Oryza meyeriana var. granulata]
MRPCSSAALHDPVLPCHKLLCHPPLEPFRSFGRVVTKLSLDFTTGVNENGVSSLPAAGNGGSTNLVVLGESWLAERKNKGD